MAGLLFGVEEYIIRVVVVFTGVKLGPGKIGYIINQINILKQT